MCIKIKRNVKIILLFANEHFEFMYQQNGSLNYCADFVSVFFCCCTQRGRSLCCHFNKKDQNISIKLTVFSIKFLLKTHWAFFTFEYARITSTMTAIINQFTFFAFIEWHLTAWTTCCTACFWLQQFTNLL